MRVFFLCIMMCLSAGWVFAGEVDLQWRQAVSLAKQGRPDFAFTNFDLIIQTYPNSRYAAPAEFAQGEYFYMQNQWRAAEAKFQAFYTRHPDDPQAPAALAYLYKLAQLQSQLPQMNKYRAQLASSHQANFIFKDRKSYAFTSGFARRHKVVFAIDKIEVWVDGTLLVEVPF